VTFINNHDFRDGSGFASLVRNNPILAYAYILTNNQIGVPTIFYPDYYGYPAPSGGLYSYHPTNLPAYKPEIDALIKVLQIYINGSPSVDYLNRFSTPYASNYIQGSADKVLIYQLQGSAGNGNKEVLVAINLGSSTLKVDHAINTRGGLIPQGTRFTDILGRSAYPYQIVNSASQVYFELPAYSYSVWVQGSDPVLPIAGLSFTATANKNKAILHWQIQENEMATSFEVQRSIDGIHYTTLSQMNASARNGNEQYNFIDEDPAFNTAILYRIKMTDKANKPNYSDIRMLRFTTAEFAVKLLVNPVRNSLQLEFKNTEAQRIQLAVFNDKAQKLLQQEFSIDAGNSNKNILLGKLPAGNYHCLIQTKHGTKETIQFSKLN